MITELVGRSVPFILGMLFAPVLVTLTAPFWRPFRITNILCTWCIPLLQFLIVFDGIVSCLRVYSPRELTELTRGLNEFEWNIKRPALGNPMIRATVLVGMPI